MRKELKDQHIDALCEEIKAYPNLYIADIGGLNSVQTSKLRRAAFRNEVKLEVVKNTLLIKALEKSGFDYSELFPVIKGETAIMLSNTNNAPAKLIKSFRAAEKTTLLSTSSPRTSSSPMWLPCCSRPSRTFCRRFSRLAIPLPVC